MRSKASGNSSQSTNRSNWGIPTDRYLKNVPDHGVRKYPVDQVVSAIQTLVAGEMNILDDATLESILSVVHYPEHLALLNTDITSTWFAMMEPYMETHSLFERSFGVLMTQVYGLVVMIGLLDHNQMLARYISELSNTGADPHKDGVLRTLSAYTSVITDPNYEQFGGTLARYIGSFASRPSPNQDLDTSDVVFLASIGGFDLKAALFVLKCLFHSRDRILDVFDRVPSFGLFQILCMIRLHLRFLLESEGGERDAIDRLAELQDVNYRYYIASAPDHHRFLSSLVAEVFGDIAGQFYEDFMDPVGSADVATISLALIRRIAPSSTGTEPVQLPNLWEMFDWAQKIILNTGEIYWYPSLLTALLNRIWVNLASGIKSAKSSLRNHILSFSGNLLMHLSESFSFEEIFGPIDMALVLFEVDFVDLIGCLIVYAAMDLDEVPKPTNVTELTCGILSLTSGLSNHSAMLKSKSLTYYPDWVKTLEHIQHLRAGLSTLDQRNPEELQGQWAALGKALGYDHDGRPHLSSACSYARCTGIETAWCRSAICTRCLKVVYCSKQCQQRDWVVGPIPHSQVCREQQGVVGAITHF
ncbi:hypothetical protein FRC08_018779 [Ceratobasidium sp. 394]|nr:hypothetical protein FRC08_018779 [Ceratobasidium sp. 394]